MSRIFLFLSSELKLITKLSMNQSYISRTDAFDVYEGLERININPIKRKRYRKSKAV
ncbi:hypothetical protein ACFL4Z_02065 [candidate division KSB1 bacterium]